MILELCLEEQELSNSTEGEEVGERLGNVEVKEKKAVTFLKI